MSSQKSLLYDGLYEGDIVLSGEQAEMFFSKYINSSTPNLKKVIKGDQYRWKMPIYYLFDGSHSK